MSEIAAVIFKRVLNTKLGLSGTVVVIFRRGYSRTLGFSIKAVITLQATTVGTWNLSQKVESVSQDKTSSFKKSEVF